MPLPIENFQDLVKEFNLELSSVLHVGAHNCEELNIYNSLNIDNKNIIWIEAIKELVDLVKKRDNSINIYNYLISDIDDKKYIFNISNNGQSSSIYEFGTHEKNHPEVKFIEKRELISKRIDSIFKIENINQKIDFLNLDIQGSELLALKGMGKMLNDIKYIYTEINTEYVYKNCCLVTEIDEYLRKYNFYRVKTGFMNEKWGWGDALYIKKERLENNFICKNIHIYPPFKDGLYMEEYFLDYYYKNNINTKRTYIPSLWTNFQTKPNINYKEMQIELNNWVIKNPNKNGYFTIIQYTDGVKLILPTNTIECGGCTPTFILPLIYEDINNTLKKQNRKKYNEKKIKCSFVGANTHNIRKILKNKFEKKNDYKFEDYNNWDVKVNLDKQNKFIDITLNSKFALAPRGYGRSSFRFYEIFNLGTIPIYIWDDIEWLPYKDEIKYEEICISINIKDIDKLDDILNSINEEKYNKMLENYNNIKYKFELLYMCEYIIKNV
jgi:FkbM family methyltransferase